LKPCPIETHIRVAKVVPVPEQAFAAGSGKSVKNV